jgi:hypothetical protein
MASDQLRFSATYLDTVSRVAALISLTVPSDVTSSLGEPNGQTSIASPRNESSFLGLYPRTPLRIVSELLQRPYAKSPADDVLPALRRMHECLAHGIPYPHTNCNNAQRYSSQYPTRARALPSMTIGLYGLIDRSMLLQARQSACSEQLIR